MNIISVRVVVPQKYECNAFSGFLLVNLAHGQNIQLFRHAVPTLAPTSVIPGFTQLYMTLCRRYPVHPCTTYSTKSGPMLLDLNSQSIPLGLAVRAALYIISPAPLALGTTLGLTEGIFVYLSSTSYDNSPEHTLAAYLLRFSLDVLLFGLTPLFASVVWMISITLILNGVDSAPMHDNYTRAGHIPRTRRHRADRRRSSSLSYLDSPPPFPSISAPASLEQNHKGQRIVPMKTILQGLSIPLLPSQSRELPLAQLADCLPTPQKNPSVARNSPPLRVLDPNSSPISPPFDSPWKAPTSSTPSRPCSPLSLTASISRNSQAKYNPSPSVPRSAKSDGIESCGREELQGFRSIVRPSQVLDFTSTTDNSFADVPALLVGCPQRSPENIQRDDLAVVSITPESSTNITPRGRAIDLPHLTTGDIIDQCDDPNDYEYRVEIPDCPTGEVGPETAATVDQIKEVAEEIVAVLCVSTNEGSPLLEDIGIEAMSLSDSITTLGGGEPASIISDPSCKPALLSKAESFRIEAIARASELNQLKAQRLIALAKQRVSESFLLALKERRIKAEMTRLHQKAERRYFLGNLCAPP
ncbi:hypothetical protein HGRIS_002450 [Hohenbuehelia grisea]|uniref:Uncharacterized protein n=1 Tax=Hohenbuehelia grisea TaxID=104357 RepID=A0ABR3JLM3_9AGAR